MNSHPDGPVLAEIRQSLVTFHRLVATAEAFLAAKKYLEAAAVAQIAGFYASYHHTGAFASPRLERLLLAIGNDTIPAVRDGDRRRSGVVRRVLHVVTAAADVGGDTRFVWRWIQNDTDRSHSVALTDQRNHEVPQVLVDAVATSGGTCHVLDAVDVIGRAQALRRLTMNADAVFLHVFPEDVVPLIAFASRANRPPIAFVVQADHQFWLGVGISDLVVHLRDAGSVLSVARRGIGRERMAFLPIPLDQVPVQNSRARAKEKLGFHEDTVVLLSIARAFKYEASTGPGFAEVAAKMLEKHKNSVLLVVGPQNVGQWKAGQERTAGRILAQGRRGDTRDFYEAADIYLNSFPFTSNTSLLEAAGHGLPLVSYFPHSEEVDVLGPGAPGIDGILLRATSIEEYEATVSRLIEHKELRTEIGDRTTKQMISIHTGAGWLDRLDELYERVVSAPLASPLLDAQNRDRVGQLDIMLKRLYSTSSNLGGAIDLYVRQLPYTARVRLLSRMWKIDRSFSFSLFLPRWLGKRLGGRMGAWKRRFLMDRGSP